VGDLHPKYTIASKLTYSNRFLGDSMSRASGLLQTHEDELHKVSLNLLCRRWNKLNWDFAVGSGTGRV
jgi:hypothetical protein